MAHKFPIAMKAELDSPKRRRALSPEKTLRSLGIVPQMVVADIGCGTGFFTIPLAVLVGSRGWVFAVDISRGMMLDIKKRIKNEGLKNVKTVLSHENNIPLPSKVLDYCLLVSVVHELENKILFFKELKRLLKKDGKAGIIEWKKKSSPLGPPLRERISPAAMRQMLAENGFAVKKTFSLGAYNYAVTATTQGGI